MNTKQKLKQAIKDHNKLIKTFKLSFEKLSMDNILDLNDDLISKSLDEIYDLYTLYLEEEVQKHP